MKNKTMIAVLLIKVNKFMTYEDFKTLVDEKYKKILDEICNNEKCLQLKYVIASLGRSDFIVVYEVIAPEIAIMFSSLLRKDERIMDTETLIGVSSVLQ